MAKYVLFFGYSSESWHRMIDNPGDRTAAARAVIEGAGGTLEVIYWMFGEWDGFAIFEAPGSINAARAASLSAAAARSGDSRPTSSSTRPNSATSSPPRSKHKTRTDHPASNHSHPVVAAPLAHDPGMLLAVRSDVDGVDRAGCGSVSRVRCPTKNRGGSRARSR